MVKQPYFMSNDSWFATNENGELVLTSLAPKDAIDVYNKMKAEYQNKVKNFSEEEYLDFIISEDSWLRFPL